MSEKTNILIQPHHKKRASFNLNMMRRRLSFSPVVNIREILDNAKFSHRTLYFE